MPLKPRARAAIPLSPSARMKELLARPDAARLVRTTPVQDLFLLVKQVGLADALELLELASGDQIQRMMDLEVWERDELRPDTYGEWLMATVEAWGSKLEALLRELDRDPLVFFLQEHIKVHLIEPEMTEQQRLELEAMNGIETPDRQYMLEFQVDDPYQDFIIQFVNRVYDAGVTEAHRLLEAVRWELPSGLEEEAYRLRSGRVEEIGLYDFYEALQIYAPLRSLKAQRRERMPQPLAGPLRDVPLALEHIRPSDGTLLSQALEEVRRQSPEDDLTRDLLRVANQVIAADRLEAGELEEIYTALRQVRAYVNLGLELQSGGSMEQAVALLRGTHLEWLFRRGYTRAIELQRRAKRLPELLRPGLRQLGAVYADSPAREALEGLAQLRPLYYTGLERRESGRFVPFQTRAQVERVSTLLDRLEAVYRFVFEFLAPAPVEVAPLRASLAAMDLELSPRGVFLTSVAQRLVGGVFAPEPLSVEALRTFLRRAFVYEGRGGGGALRPLAAEFVGQVEASVEAFAGEATALEVEHVRAFVEEGLSSLRESYGALELEPALRVELVGGPLYLRSGEEGDAGRMF